MSFRVAGHEFTIQLLLTFCLLLEWMAHCNPTENHPFRGAKGQATVI